MGGSPGYCRPTVQILPEILTVSVLAARTLFVTVRSSCGAHTIDITPCGARPVPEQEPLGRRTVSLGRRAACSRGPYDMIRGFLTDAVRRLEICDRVLYDCRGSTMSEKTTIARRGHYLTVPVAFVTEPVAG